jgi:UDP-N-acetylmuramoylalanine--D-glutamate ligase
MGRAMINDLSRTSDWSDVSVCVAGIRLAGAACARATRELGATVTAVDAGDSAEHRRWAAELASDGVEVVLGDSRTLPPATELLIVSPGFPPTAPIIVTAQERGVPVWGELELAWRLRGPDPAPWLVITGTNGKTTATLMLESMMQAAGLRAIAAANIGVSLVDAVLHQELDVIAVEVGAPQLPFWHTVAPLGAAVLNLAEDHVDHFGSYQKYVAAKGRIFDRCTGAVVYNCADPQTQALAAAAELGSQCQRVGFTLGVPEPGQFGVVEQYLIDRVFTDDPVTEALELAELSDVKPYAPHNVANALAAAALARCFGIDTDHVKNGLRQFEPAGHRITEVGVHSGVSYVDDSKATNAHAALTSLSAYKSVVWIAGGLAKGQSFDDLVQRRADTISAVVLLGADQDLIAQALQRHAPQIPVLAVTTTDTMAMAEVVRCATELAHAGDTVLLAPGCASWDMFENYAQRGTLFAQEVAKLHGTD